MTPMSWCRAFCQTEAFPPCFLILSSMSVYRFSFPLRYSTNMSVFCAARSFVFNRGRENRSSGNWRSLAHWTEPGERVEAARDPDDNRFLECALAGEVEFVVTGNLRHFPRTFRAIRVLSPRQFFEIYCQSVAPEQN
jgi:hypothetical protein